MLKLLTIWVSFAPVFWRIGVIYDPLKFFKLIKDPVMDDVKNQ